MALFGNLLLHRDAVFKLSRLFLTARISPGTLCFVLSFVGIHSAAASTWAMISNSSFGVNVSDISWKASNLFLVRTNHSMKFRLILSYPYRDSDVSLLRKNSHSKDIYIYIYPNTHTNKQTHTHTHTHIYIYIYMGVNNGEKSNNIEKKWIKS